MLIETPESQNAICHRLLVGISEVDSSSLRAVCTENVVLNVPGARDVDLTKESQGTEAICQWAKAVHTFCGKTIFSLHRYFENGCELMAVGKIHIERHPRVFESACAIHLRFESGRVASFQLLLDTYALDKFRGEMD
jgi:ketosteroid isomerase-like protein